MDKSTVRLMRVSVSIMRIRRGRNPLKRTRWMIRPYASGGWFEEAKSAPYLIEFILMLAFTSAMARMRAVSTSLSAWWAF